MHVRSRIRHLRTAGAAVAVAVAIAGCGVAEGAAAQDTVADVTQVEPSESATETPAPVTAEVDPAAVTDDGVSDTTNAAESVDLDTLPSEWLDLAAGEEHLCGIAADQSVWCWDAGRRDAAVSAALASNDPQQVDAGPWKSITAGSYYTCGIKTDDTAWCWGSVGDEDPSYSEPVEVAGDASWRTLSASWFNTCGIQADGSAWCWGTNEHGALGDGSEAKASDAPVEVAGDGTWTDISVGHYSACGIKDDGSAWCWGWNMGGALGDGTTDDSTTPVRVLGDHVWRQISTAYFHTCAIDTDDALWCWGHLDENPKTDPGPQLSPIEVAPGTHWSTLTTGSGITCGITTDHEASCWGWNGNGQLGSNVTDSTTTPTPVADGTHAATISAGYISGITCMTKTDHSGLCWGGYTIGNDDPRGAVTQPVRIGAPA